MVGTMSTSAAAAAVAPLASSGLSPPSSSWCSMAWHCAPASSCSMIPWQCAPASRWSNAWRCAPPSCSAAAAPPAPCWPKPCGGASRGSSADFGGSQQQQMTGGGCCVGTAIIRHWDVRPPHCTRVVDPGAISHGLPSGSGLQPSFRVRVLGHHHRCVSCPVGRASDGADEGDEQHGHVKKDEDGGDGEGKVGAGGANENPLMARGADILSVTELHDGSMVFEFAWPENSEEPGALSDDSRPLSSKQSLDEKPVPDSLSQLTAAENQMPYDVQSKLQDKPSPSSSPAHQPSTGMKDAKEDTGRLLSSASDTNMDPGRVELSDSSTIVRDDSVDEPMACSREEAVGDNNSATAGHHDNGDTRLPPHRSHNHPSTFHKMSPIPAGRTGVREPPTSKLVGKGHVERGHEGRDETEKKVVTPPEEGEQLLSLPQRPPSAFIRVSPVRLWQVLQPSPASLRREGCSWPENSRGESPEVSASEVSDSDAEHCTPAAQRPPSSFSKVSPIPPRGALRPVTRTIREPEGNATHNAEDVSQLETHTESTGDSGDSAREGDDQGDHLQDSESTESASTFSSPHTKSSSSKTQQMGKRRRRSPARKDSDGSQQGVGVSTADSTRATGSLTDVLSDMEAELTSSEKSESDKADSETSLSQHVQPDLADKHDSTFDADQGQVLSGDVHQAPGDEMVASNRHNFKVRSGRKTMAERGGRGREKPNDIELEDSQAEASEVRQDGQEPEVEAEVAMINEQHGKPRAGRRPRTRKGGRESEKEEDEKVGGSTLDAAEAGDDLPIMETTRRRRGGGKRVGRGEEKAGKKLEVDEPATIQSDPPTSSPQSGSAELHVTDLHTQTLVELKGIARTLGVRGFSAMKKSELVEALTSFLATLEEQS